MKKQKSKKAGSPAATGRAAEVLLMKRAQVFVEQVGADDLETRYHEAREAMRLQFTMLVETATRQQLEEMAFYFGVLRLDALVPQVLTSASDEPRPIAH